MNKSTIKKIFNNNRINFYLLLLATFILILFSNPFLRYPYDIWPQLIRIDDVYAINKLTSRRPLWYLFWAKAFYFFSIEDVFLRAKIIHVIQSIVSLLSVFFFSQVLIRNLFKDTDKTTLKYLSYWSVITWLTVYATFSMYYHQVWIMWYSVSYQISLAFFWYVTALTIILVFEKNNIYLKLFYSIQIVFFSYIILSIHAMELIYYFMYLMVLIIVFFDRILSVFKEKYYILILMSLLVCGLIYYYFSYLYHDRIPQLFHFLESGRFIDLYDNIMKNGQILVEGHNRAFASINELMVVIFFVGAFILIDIIRRKLLKKESNINFRLFLFIIISSFFVVIPLNQFTAGLASNIFHSNVVNRIYYSSSLYILLPVGVYYFGYLFNKKVNIIKTNISIVLIIFLTLLYSMYISESHNYYKNVKSLVNSFDETKVGFHLSQENIITIGEHLEKYESTVISRGKPNVYFSRPDIAYVIKYIYRKKVFWNTQWNGRNGYGLEEFDAYLKKYQVRKRMTPIVFKTPENFPDYVPYR